MTTATNSDCGVRMPAEWEPQQAVLLAMPHEDTDWACMLDDACRCFARIAEAIAPFATVIVATPWADRCRRMLSRIPEIRLRVLVVPTNDTWTRDYGPITTVDADGSIVLNDFKFNGWGLKFAADRDNLVTRALCESGMPEGQYANRLGFVLEGGSVESDGCGTLLTTSRCLMSANRNGDLTRAEITDRLGRWLGARKVLWLDHGYLAGDDTDSHIDTLARLAPHNTILFTGCSDPADEHYGELTAMRRQLEVFTNADGRPFNLIELPLPEPIFDTDGQRLPATYANFLIINNAVIMPVYGQPRRDRLALDTMRVVFPDHVIVPVDCNALIRQHGSLHCSTMQIMKIR